MTLFRWLVVGYLVLLGLSHLLRLGAEPEPAADAGLEFVLLAPDSATADRLPEIQVAFRSWQPANADSDIPTVVLLHGSPGSSLDFANLGPGLGQRYHVIAPDLPGFGASERHLPDYSIRTHAAYVLTLLRALDIEPAHLVGFSMGGGVALEMLDSSPTAARSLTLLSAIGVQELELLGDYHLNRALHAFQLGFLWLCREAIPHFGSLDDSVFSVEYARNFYDSDQRPLRQILERVEVPTLILHGEHDILVPVAAAKEHHRLVPQSELILLDANHFMVFRGEVNLVRPISDFIDRVESGTAKRREDASPERIAAAALPFDPSVVPEAAGVTLLVLVGLIALATLLTEDLACIGAGLLVAQGRIGFLAATLACFVGIVVGDILLYAAGRYFGYPALSRAPIKWLVSSNQVERASAWFERRGPAVVFLTRFLPGTRVAAYTTAGLLRTNFYRFLLYFALAVAIWTPILVGVSAYFGSRILDHFALIERYTLPFLLALLLALWLLAKLIPLLFTWRGRRRLLGRWCRLRHWEFWPPWLFYPPIVAWILWLGFRHRSLTVFTAANPAIPAAGFVGESKADILERLDPQMVASFERISARLNGDDRLARVHSFANRYGLDLPLVLKPDAGERGRGVIIAKDWRQVEDYCRTARNSFLVQRYVAGREFGVFYTRHPDRKTGSIFSITTKQLPVLTADGVSTIEDLVLADSRAVCLASLYLQRLTDRRDEIPPAGERVPLAELGTHCRGAVFLDGTELATTRLATAIDRVSKGFEGFFFGRYDIRVPTIEDFQEGRNLQIVELNGVTSEATDIYDPANSLLDAYKKLARQWSLAFAIGERNRIAGARTERLSDLLRSIRDHRRSQ
ncbi:MAG: alpha/beta fold hydrolase [Acidobacteriota bacterium]